jgi:hypothetical protein
MWAKALSEPNLMPIAAFLIRRRRRGKGMLRFARQGARQPDPFRVGRRGVA